MIRFLLTFVVLLGSLVGQETYNDVAYNPLISSKERKALEPYILPSNHLIKPLLDAIFLSGRVTQDKKTLVDAGFEILRDQPRSFILVARHPSVPGYLFKLHIDKDLRKKKGKPGWYWFSKRLKGIREIEACIKENNLTLFKTPEKWVYPLPINPSPPGKESYKRKNFVLIAEDMNIYNDEENVAMWKTHITRQHLDQIKIIFDTCGGGSLKPRNLPFSYDGKIAFIDTEYPGNKITYSSLNYGLNDEMKEYWREITKKK